MTQQASLLDQILSGTNRNLQVLAAQGLVPLPPEDWIDVATAQGDADGDGLFLSGSFTTMLEAVAPIEAAMGKPVVTSVQAALWAGINRLSDRIGAYKPVASLGRLFQAL